MMTRYLSSAGIGIAVTTALLWTMNALIDLGETVQTKPRPRLTLVWAPPIDDTPVETKVKPPKKVIAAKQPPAALPRERAGDVIPVGIPVAPTAPSGPDFGSGLPANVDSGLINIINVQPDYPAIASAKGLEGYVVVEFDVTELGTIENVRVVESSSSVFDKAAIRAAYRSKYKPKTVDGVAYRSQGLRKLYRFEMET